MCQAFGQVFDGRSFGRKYSTGESIAGRLVQNIQRFFHFLRIVHIYGEHRSEKLFAHSDVIGLFSQNYRGMDEISRGFIAFSTQYDFSIWRFGCIINVFSQFVERFFVYHSIHKIGEILHITHFDFLQIFSHITLNLFPYIRWNIGARCSRTFLALIFECAADEGCGNLSGIGCGIGKNIVFSARFAHNARIAAIAGYVFRNGFPHAVEYRCGTGEM